MKNVHRARTGSPVSRALNTMTAIATALCIATAVLMPSYNGLWLVVGHFLIWSVYGAEMRRASRFKHDQPTVAISAEQRSGR